MKIKWEMRNCDDKNKMIIKMISDGSGFVQPSVDLEMFGFPRGSGHGHSFMLHQGIQRGTFADIWVAHLKTYDKSRQKR